MWLNIHNINDTDYVQILACILFYVSGLRTWASYKHRREISSEHFHLWQLKMASLFGVWS